MFSPTKQLDLGNRFRKDVDAYYVEAKRSTVASIAQIPTWMYGLLLVLGWNEAMFILFNPLYFALLLLAAASAYVINQLGLAGPLMQVTKTVAGEVRELFSVWGYGKINYFIGSKPGCNQASGTPSATYIARTCQSASNTVSVKFKFYA